MDPLIKKSLIISVDNTLKDLPNTAILDRFARVKQNVFAREQYRCQFCQLQSAPDKKAPKTSPRSTGYLELHNINGDHGNLDESNLTTICPFCFMVIHFDVAAHQKDCFLIHFPWLKQTELNLLVACIGVIIERKGSFCEDAKTLFDWLKSHNQDLSELHGPDMSDPIQLARILKTIFKKEVYKNRGKALVDYRILPDIKKFQKQLQYWSSIGWLNGQNWEDLWKTKYQEWSQKIG